MEGVLVLLLWWGGGPWAEDRPLAAVQAHIEAARFQQAFDQLDQLAATRTDPAGRLGIAALRSRGLLLRGLIYRDRGRHGEALAMLEDLLPHLSKVDDHNVRAHFIRAHAGALMSNRRGEEARARFVQALAIYEQAGNASGAAGVRALLIMMDAGRPRREKDRERLAELIPRFESQIEQARACGNLVALGYDQRHLGAVYREGFGQLEKALAFYQASLESRRQAGFIVLLPASLYSVGEILTELGREREALDYFQESLALAEKIGFRRYQISPALAMGDIHAAAGRVAQAKAQYQAALEAATREGHQPSMEQARQKLSSM